MSTYETIAKLAKNSEAEHQKLVARRETGDLFFEPDATSLHAAELITHREWQTIGRTDRSAYSRFFVDAATAWAGACDTILTWYEENKYAASSPRDKEVQMLITSGRHERAAHMFSAMYSTTLRFEVKSIEIRSNPKAHEISEPPTTETTTEPSTTEPSTTDG